MNGIIAFLSAIPELIKLFKAIDKQMKSDAKKTASKESVARLRKAIEEKDDKTINDLFNSLNSGVRPNE